VPGADDYIGKTIASKYRVEQLIGEGGMGRVYKANQIALDKPVVLKVLRQALLSDERTVARFQREAKAASRLNHPNSISVLDFGQAEDGAMYIAMEYVQGKDLHHILSREWPLPEARVIRIIGQVLSALADAHSAGVIHRDLKPENIMVEQRRGEADFVKVLDFGIAKIIDGTGDDGPALTRAGFVCGTPEYMSPEQARGAQLDHRSDLYGVGVILYQLTSGLLPFDSDSAVGFATKHLTEIPPTPNKRRPEAKVSPAMERLVMKSLAKNADDRPQTAEQFRAELQAIEKERRAAGASARRNVTSQSSASSLNPVSNRKMTPLEQQETRVNPSPNSPWAQKEDTVRSQPDIAEVDKTGLFGSGPNGKIFRVATGILLAIGLALAAVYAYSVYARPDDAEPKDLFEEGGQKRLINEPLKKMGTLDIEAAIKTGDDAWGTHSWGFAETQYIRAWQSVPTVELAVKLCELNVILEKPSEAREYLEWLKLNAPKHKSLPYFDSLLKTNP
jgi:eukaryotic-like serine/threonine-protein kinase